LLFSKFVVTSVALIVTAIEVVRRDHDSVVISSMSSSQVCIFA
jgi:hypothetical protein